MFALGNIIGVPFKDNWQMAKRLGRTQRYRRVCGVCCPPSHLSHSPVEHMRFAWFRFFGGNKALCLALDFLNLIDTLLEGSFFIPIFRTGFYNAV